MPLPKRRHSKSRRDKRRTHQELSAPALTKCPQCQAYIRAHNACPKCGYYQGEKVDHTVKQEKQSHEQK